MKTDETWLHYKYIRTTATGRKVMNEGELWKFAIYLNSKPQQKVLYVENDFFEEKNRNFQRFLFSEQFFIFKFSLSPIMSTSYIISYQ